MTDAKIKKLKERLKQATLEAKCYKKLYFELLAATGQRPLTIPSPLPSYPNVVSVYGVHIMPPTYGDTTADKAKEVL
jgi:hypothetical protein